MKKFGHFTAVSLILLFIIQASAEASRCLEVYNSAGKTVATKSNILSTEDAVVAWDKSVGAVWAIALQSLNINPNGTVIEVAPGERAKVGYGLAEIGFQGTLYVVEPSGPSLGRVVEKYKKILPRATIIGVEKVLDQALSVLPRNSEALLSNHPLDDMVLAYDINTQEKTRIFDSISSLESFQTVTRAWRSLGARPSSISKAQVETINSWQRAIESLTPANLAISQYESGFFKQHELSGPDQAALGVLKVLQKRFGVPDKLISDRIDRFRMQGDRWLVSRLRPGSIQDTPGAVERLGRNMFVEVKAELIPNPEDSVLFKSDDFSTPIEQYAVRLGGDSHSGGRKVSVYADRQEDPLNIAMNGNKGSGRAAYVSRDLNLKGLGKTPLAVSKDAEHSNGGLDLGNAVWEMLGSNMTYTNFRTSSSRVVSLLDRGDFVKVAWSEKPQKAAILVRKDANGSLDRPTHLFASGKPVSRDQLLEIARSFGEQDAEKYIERIVHGAWSSGNISLSGHMIDFDSVGALVGRAPVYTLTGKWLGNQFGLENIGQMKILETILENKINFEGVAIEEVRRAFASGRYDMMMNRFPDLLGIPSVSAEGFLARHWAELKTLVEKFDQLGRYMFPKFNSMAGWLPESQKIAVFDISRFLRLYPLLKKNQRNVDLLKLMSNSPDLELSESEWLGTDVRVHLENRNLIVNSPKRLAQVRAEALQFITAYEKLMQPYLQKGLPESKADEIVAQSYRANEDRTYLIYGTGYDLVKKITINYSENLISKERFSRLLELLQISVDRLPIKSANESALVDLRIHREGWTARRLYADGSSRRVVGLFKDQLDIKTLAFEITSEGIPLNAREQKNASEIIFESEILSVADLLNSVVDTQVKLNQKPIQWHSF